MVVIHDNCDVLIKAIAVHTWENTKFSIAKNYYNLLTRPYLSRKSCHRSQQVLWWNFTTAAYSSSASSTIVHIFLWKFHNTLMLCKGIYIKCIVNSTLMIICWISIVLRRDISLQSKISKSRIHARHVVNYSKPDCGYVQPYYIRHCNGGALLVFPTSPPFL